MKLFLLRDFTLNYSLNDAKKKFFAEIFLYTFYNKSTYIYIN